MKKFTVRKLVLAAILAAISIVLVALVHFPIFPNAPWMEYDPADIPILIGGFVCGPWVGLLITVVASVIQGVTVSAGSGWIGIVMHILATGLYVVSSSFIFRRNYTRKNAAIGLGVGVIVMAVAMAGLNMIFTPMFSGMPAAEVAKLLIPVIIPFNLIKAGINAVITFLLYKAIAKAAKLELK